MLQVCVEVWVTALGYTILAFKQTSTPSQLSIRVLDYVQMAVFMSAKSA